MKLRKAVWFLLVMVTIIYMIPVTVSASAGYDLGEFTIVSENNNQNGWCTHGVDGIETNLYMRALKRVTNLVFEFDTQVDNIALVCMGDGNNWTWTETPVEVNGTWVSIEVSNINGWEEVMTGNDAKIILCKYNPGWESTKIVTAYTSMPGGPFSDGEAWTPKEFTIGSGKTIITAVDFDPDSYEEHGTEYARYAIRPEMEAVGGPQTEVGGSGFGDNICCIDAGEWIQYTVTAETAGTYSFSAWLACDGDAHGNIEIYVDGVLAGASGDCIGYTYDIYTVGSIDISTGTHIVKAVFPKGGVAFTALEVTYGNTLESESSVVHKSAQTGEMGITDCMLMILSSGILFASAKTIGKKSRYTK